jgi:hypothetical protein
MKIDQADEMPGLRPVSPGEGHGMPQPKIAQAGPIGGKARLAAEAEIEQRRKSFRRTLIRHEKIAIGHRPQLARITKQQNYRRPLHQQNGDVPGAQTINDRQAEIQPRPVLQPGMPCDAAQPLPERYIRDAGADILIDKGKESEFRACDIVQFRELAPSEKVFEGVIRCLQGRQQQQALRLRYPWHARSSCRMLRKLRKIAASA